LEKHELYAKNDFVEISKNLDLKIILLDHENNYVINSKLMSNPAKKNLIF